MVVTAPGTRARYTFRKSVAAVMSAEDNASPRNVPPTPKREVRTATAGEDIPTATTLGRSKMVCLFASSKENPSSLPSDLPGQKAGAPHKGSGP